MNEYQPHELGMVAMVKNQHGVWNRAILTLTAGGYAWRPGCADTFYHPNLEVRPLAVIDPEDEAQVQRLHDVFEAKWLVEHPRAHSAYSCNSGTCRTDVFQAAFREFASPTPPIEEPLDIGSVIADQDGRLWARVATGDPGGPWWTREGDGPDDSMSYPHHWGDLSAREIRSEGYAGEES